MRTTLALVVALAVVVGGGWLVDDVVLGDDIPRNVEVDGVDIGGLDEEEATEALAGLTVLDRQITLTWADRSITRSAAELGVEVDVDATLDEAADRGSGAGRVARWFSSLVVTREVSAVVTLDPSDLEVLFSTDGEAAFEIIRPLPEIELVEGEFVAESTGGVPVPDTVALAAAILDALATDDDPATVAVPTTGEVIELDDPALLAEINELTEGGVTVSLVGDPSEHVIPEAAVRSWIVLGGTAEEPSIELDDEAVLTTLRSLFVGLGEQGEEAEFFVDFVGGIHIVGGAPGSVCCEPDTAEVILAGMRAGDDVIDVRPQEDPDAKGVAWAESLGITELVGTFTTNFQPGQSRVENIDRISELTRGAVIEPGETFSVNDYVGRRTPENGFVSAGVIVNGVFTSSVGGGISQYATTLFNAAFFAGLDFGEYQSHSIYISRYPYGREATVSFPAPDLQIVNTTPYGVLLWPTTTADSVTVQLYSTRWATGEQTGQKERTEGVACTRVTTERTRTFTDGRTETDEVTARYRPEGINCDGSSTVPTTTTTAPPSTTTVAPPTTAPPTTTPSTTLPPDPTTTTTPVTTTTAG